MSIYKNASRVKLRFQTTRGMLSAEQLWDLPLKELAASVKEVKKTLKESDLDDDLSFLSETKTNTVAETENQLRFEILKDVYVTKKSEIEAAHNAAEIKEHNQKILARIAKNNEKALDELSNDELQKLLK